MEQSRGRECDQSRDNNASGCQIKISHVRYFSQTTTCSSYFFSSSATRLTSGTLYQPLVWMFSGFWLLACGRASEMCGGDVPSFLFCQRGFASRPCAAVLLGPFIGTAIRSYCPLLVSYCTFLYFLVDNSCRCRRETPKSSSTWMDPRVREAHLQTQLPLVNPSFLLNCHQCGGGGPCLSPLN